MRKIIVGIVLLALAGGGYWYFTRPKATLPVITTMPQRLDLEDSVLASGTITAFNTVKVGARASGQLQRLHVKLGDRVSKGQLLAEIDPLLQKNSLKDAQAGLLNVQAQKKAKEALLRQYKLAFTREQRMHSQDASAGSNLEIAQAQLESTKAELDALEAQIVQARVAVDTATVNLGYTRISAPIDGVVVSIETEEGQTVIAAQTVPTILTLAQLDTVTVKAEISEADVMRVQPGLPVYCTTLGGGTRYESTLRDIEPGPSAEVDTSSASSSTAIYYNGLFELPNPEHKLRVSMTTQVTIVLSRASQALCIPVSSLGPTFPDGRTEVAVLKDGKPEKRMIRLGISNKVMVQVLEGLQDSDELVVGDSASLPVENATRPRRGPGGPPPGGA